MNEPNYKPNFHVFEVKYLGPTNYRGSRVKITSLRYSESRTFSFDDRFNYAAEQAVAWLENVQGFHVIGTAENDIAKVNYVISDTFKPFFK